MHIAPVPEPRPMAGGRWNTYEITLQGPRLRVVLNGETTVDVEDSQFASGPFALQWGRGTMRFRRVEASQLFSGAAWCGESAILFFTEWSISRSVLLAK